VTSKPLSPEGEGWDKSRKSGCINGSWIFRRLVIMIDIDIPGFGPVHLEHFVSDFTGTLSVDGKLLPGIRERLNRIAEHLKVHILTADTFGMAKKELENVDCEIHILAGKDHDVQKEDFVRRLGADTVAAFGNGSNDRRMPLSPQTSMSGAHRTGSTSSSTPRG
jgi:soluble P-type ATPase